MRTGQTNRRADMTKLKVAKFANAPNRALLPWQFAAVLMPQRPEDKTKCFKQDTASPNIHTGVTIFSNMQLSKATVRPRWVQFLASTIPRPDSPRHFPVGLCERCGLRVCSASTYNLNNWTMDYEHCLQKMTSLYCKMFGRLTNIVLYVGKQIDHIKNSKGSKNISELLFTTVFVLCVAVTFL